MMQMLMSLMEYRLGTIRTFYKLNESSVTIVDARVAEISNTTAEAVIKEGTIFRLASL